MTAEVADAQDGCMSRVTSRLLQPSGRSGHSLFRKARFALSLSSPYTVFGLVSSAKDIYLEKFGLDATVLGGVYTVVTLCAPLQEIIIGRLQDKEILAPFFPVKSWGRRAPWLLTHGILAALAASVLYLPPSGDMAYVYYASLHMAAMWGACACCIAFESARQEIYPYKEERIFVEGLCKYACMVGGGAGGLVALVFTVNATWQVRLAFTLYIFPMALLSLEAVPIFREARGRQKSVDEVEPGKPHESEGMGALVILWEALPRRLRMLLRWSSEEREDNRALQHLLALKFWNGAYGVVLSSMLLYYVTYVLKLSSTSRALVIMAAGSVAGCTETVMSFFFMRIFSSGDSLKDVCGKSDRKLLSLVVTSRLVNAALTILLIGVVEPSVPVLLIWAALCRICLSSFSFWRISAQCWLVDEDCLGGGGQRKVREGMIFGALSFSEKLAAAVFSSLIFLGLGIAGLKTENCESSYESYADLLCSKELSQSECIDVCFNNVIQSQPSSLRIYVKLMIGCFAPFCELLVAYHTRCFPIKGSRLRKLCLSVAAERGESDGELCMEAQCSDDAHVGASQVVIGMLDLDHSAGDFAARIVHTQSMVSGWKGSKSVSVMWLREKDAKGSTSLQL